MKFPLHTYRLAVYRGINAYSRYLKKLSSHPKKHLPDNMTMSFDLESDTMYVNNGYLHCQGFINKSALGFKVGEIKCQNIGLTKNDKLLNGSIFIDNLGKFYLYFVRIYNKISLNYPKTHAIGIDLGYRLDGSNTIVCSNGDIYHKPDTTHLENRIRNFQSIMQNDKNNRNNTTLSNREQQNILKFQKAYKKLTNVLHDFYNQSTIDIIKKNPEAIVIEDNFAQELKSNSKNNFINYGNTSSGIIRKMLIYKANLHNIPVYVAKREFKSTYICSRCGRISNYNLKQQKIFKCSFCEYQIDRDLNAAINLENIFNWKDSPISYNSFIKEIL